MATYMIFLEHQVHRDKSRTVVGGVIYCLHEKQSTALSLIHLSSGEQVFNGTACHFCKGKGVLEMRVVRHL